MRGNWLWVALLCAGACGAGTIADLAGEKDGEAGEQKISADQVPPKAMEALKKFAGTNKIEGFIQEVAYGGECFEAEWQIDGKDHAAQVTADGVVLATEYQVDVKDVPEAVQKTAKKALKGAAEIGYIRKEVVMYEAEGKVKGKSHQV